MSFDRQKFLAEAANCLGENRPAGELVDCVATHFPEVEAYRQQDDLIIRGGTRFLVVRRAGPDGFHVAENVTVPTTNLVDFGGGATRTLGELVDEIANFAN
jgi:hypothetical protein